MAIKRLLNGVRKQDFDVIIVEHFDRLSRDPATIQRLKQVFEFNRVELMDQKGVYAARLAQETSLPRADLREAGIQLVFHAIGGLLVLLVPTILSVYKPPGLTRYGWRKQFEQRLQS